MKKALIIASVASMIEQFNMNNIKLLQNIGYEVDVATNFENSGTITRTKSIELKQKLENINVNCFEIDFNRSIFSKDNIKAYRQLKEIIDKNNYELIHMHSPIGGVCGRLAARKARKRGTKVIYTAHGFHFFKGAPLINWITFYPIEKYLSKYTDCLITINQEDYELAKRKLKTKKIELIHGVGVDESKFNFKMSQENEQQLRKSLGLKDDDFVLIQVGELNKNKNQIMAINAIKDLIREYPNIHLLLVGIGKLEDFYKQKIEEYDLSKYVHMLGYRNDVPNLMKISDVLLSLSYREGLPVNVIEALTSGLPVIATNCRGNRDLVKNGENGYIIEIDDIKSLKERMLEIKNDKVVLNNFKMSEYSLEKIENRYMIIYH